MKLILKDEKLNQLDLILGFAPKGSIKYERRQQLVDLLAKVEAKAEEKGRREVIDKAFDWIWSLWNLDYGNLDRSKEHFINSLTPEKENK